MLITLPISELVPGMFVDSVSKQFEGVDSIKIKTRGLVRDKSIIKRLMSEGVQELLIDFTQSDVSVPTKYQLKPDAELVTKADIKPKKAKIKKNCLS